jgi:phosphoribosyl-ATP pyrophosphohydrolase/phosphoribosyl-AMP cyclohydrolase
MSESNQATIVLDDKRLIPAICQDSITGEVLMLAYMNPESIKATIETGDVVFYSRSRSELWHKGKTSGNYMRVESILVDCDEDTLLIRVRPEGPACHTGNTTCFFREFPKAPDFEFAGSGPGILSELFEVIQERKLHPPENSYTAKLFAAGTSRIAQKVAEEAAEVAIAAATKDTQNLSGEIADLLYHTLVLISDANLTLEMVWEKLQQRRLA